MSCHLMNVVDPRMHCPLGSFTRTLVVILGSLCPTASGCKGAGLFLSVNECVVPWQYCAHTDDYFEKLTKGTREA